MNIENLKIITLVYLILQTNQLVQADIQADDSDVSDNAGDESDDDIFAC